MTRLLALVLVAFILWLVLEALIGRVRVALGGRVRMGAMPRQGSGQGAAQGKPEVAAEDLVRCAGCGIFVPRSRVMRGAGAGESYCSERCLRSAVRTS
jgi:hypothetical protein